MIMAKYWKVVGLLAFCLSIIISGFIFYKNSNSRVVQVEKNQVPAVQSNSVPKREMKL